MTQPVEPGALAVLHVTFVEDRAGRAIVRLPNGSKTTLDYGAVRVLGGAVDFVAHADRAGETAWCREQGCEWHHEAGSRTAAEDEYLAHLAEAHAAAHSTAVVAAVAAAAEAGCPVAGHSPDSFEEIAGVAMRRWASARRRHPKGLDEERRVEDLAKGLVARFEKDEALAGPLIEDYRYLARQIAAAIYTSD